MKKTLSLVLVLVFALSSFCINVTAKKYFLGIPTKTLEETITITCSANGTLS